MARIETYVTDNLVTENDIVIGTDGDNLNKTKNFKVSALTQFVESVATNNVAKIVTTSVGVNETIESKLSGINLTVTGEDSPVLLSFLKEDIDESTGNNIVRKFLYLFPLGNGTYNPLSDTVSLDDLVLLNVTNPTADDVSGLGNTVTIDLGDITGSSLVDEVNTSVPSLNLSSTETQYFFTFIDGGTSFLFKFVGTNGLYGSNDLQSTVSDFLSFSDNTVDDDNVKAKYVQVTLNNSYSDESQEIAGVVSQINGLSPNVEISDKELFIAFSNGNLENDAGASYNSVYIINSGKGVYGSGSKQITSSNVIKIRGEKINENLSSFNNDAGFATETYVDNADDLKVSKSGDTMTGNLDMSNNNITNLGLPNNDQDAANKFYVDSLKRYRGNFTNSSNIIALSGSNGDYATLSNGDANQLWVYQDTEWILESAKPYVVDISSNTTLTNDFHKATINVTTGNINLDLPDGLIDGLEFNIRNFSGGTLTFNLTGANTATETTLPTNNLGTVILSGTEYIVDTTSSDVSENINMGIYDYEDTQAAQTLVANTYQNISNNGAGGNTYLAPAPGVPNIYNIATDRFDFTGLNINDIVRIRLDLDLTTTTTGENFDAELVLGEGQTGEYIIPFFSSMYFRDADTYRIVEEREIYIGNNLTKDNPAFIRVRSTAADDVDVNGFYVRVVKRS